MKSTALLLSVTFIATAGQAMAYCPPGYHYDSQYGNVTTCLTDEKPTYNPQRRYESDISKRDGRGGREQTNGSTSAR